MYGFSSRAVESHPFDCAQGRLFRKKRERMGTRHPSAFSTQWAGVVESRPFDCAQGRLFRKVRERMGHPSVV
jgi:hypothetical protein